MFEYENKYRDYKYIAGMDEAGRGPLAGPVVCACVVMDLDKDKIVDGVNDSKKLTPKKREKLYDEIVKNAICYKILEIDEKVIDKINILQATKLGMKQAVEGLLVEPDIVLIDAVRIDSDVKQQPIIHGDALSYSIACASILAKVYRDRKMVELSKVYPQYQFDKHKGYGTKLHIELLKKYGKCPIHRESFIKNFI